MLAISHQHYQMQASLLCSNVADEFEIGLAITGDHVMCATLVGQSELSSYLESFLTDPPKIRTQVVVIQQIKSIAYPS